MKNGNARMSLPATLARSLELPVVGSPLFIGQGIGQIGDAPSVADLVRRLGAELAHARDNFATRLSA